jgi:dolichol-phosphate mannosyltransferase
MDADMQHDETLLPAMLTCLKKEPDLEVVVGSRYAAGGSVEGWDQRRRIISRIATKLARLLTKADLHDPMSGFFLIRREAFDRVVRNLSQHGFAILLNLCGSASPPLRVKELPYKFRPRERGESKLDSMAAWEYAMLLADKLFGSVFPPRFVFFAVVGASGLFVHLAVLALALHAGATFALAQTSAVILAIASNFTLNNILTYRDRRLEGWQFVRGLLSFYVICSVGALANVGIASLMYGNKSVWWFAGLSGAAIGAVWNYAVSSYVTWRNR